MLVIFNLCRDLWGYGGFLEIRFRLFGERQPALNGLFTMFGITYRYVKRQNQRPTVCLFTRWFSTAFRVKRHRKCCRGRLGSVRATPPGGQRLDVRLYGPSSNSVCFDVEPEGGALTAEG